LESALVHGERTPTQEECSSHRCERFASKSRARTSQEQRRLCRCELRPSGSRRRQDESAREECQKTFAEVRCRRWLLGSRWSIVDQELGLSEFRAKIFPQPFSFVQSPLSLTGCVRPPARRALLQVGGEPSMTELTLVSPDRRQRTKRFPSSPHGEQPQTNPLPLDGGRSSDQRHRRSSTLHRKVRKP
jgi:hypothetical protein